MTDQAFDPATARVVLRDVGPFGAALGGDDAPLLRGMACRRNRTDKLFAPPARARGTVSTRN
jgi:hypothetical protein